MNRFVLLLLLALTRIGLGQKDSCPLNCLNDSDCAPGDADFSDHQSAYGSEMPFHRVKSVGGYHCECKEGFTDVLCNRPYTTCTYEFRDQPFNVKCYNGASCVNADTVQNDKLDTNLQVCDCSTADYDNTFYGGLFCEIEVPQSARCPVDPENAYCLNGGVCEQKGDTSRCVCPDDHIGDHCEYDASNFYGANGDENCDLHCQNGGVCRHGFGNWGDDDGKHCDCMYGFGGVYCERRSLPCGTGTGVICVDGQKCSAWDDGEPRCIPDEGFTTCNREPGIHNVYKDGTPIPYFCSNNGKCKDEVRSDGTVHTRCECPRGFEGPHCELTLDGNLASDMERQIIKEEVGGGRNFVLGMISMMGIVIGGYYIVLKRRARRFNSRKGDGLHREPTYADDNLAPSFTTSKYMKESITENELMMDVNI